MSNQTEISQTDAYVYGTALLITNLVRCSFNHNCMFYIQQLAIRVRVAICSLLYRKILKLNDCSNGQIISLISKDVYLFDMALMFGHDLWIGIIQTIIMTIIMYKAIGIASFVGIGFMVLVVPIEGE